MEIKVIKTTKAASCIKGISTEEYLAGETYDIFDSLAKIFIKEGWGMEVQEEKKEEKSFKIKLENKAIEKVEEDKNIEQKSPVTEMIEAKKKSTKKKGKK